MKVIEDIKMYLNSDASLYDIGPRKTNFFESLKIGQEHIELFDKQDYVPDNIDKIIECIDYLNNLVIDRKLSDVSKQFIRNYVYLVHNLNENIYQNKELEKQLSFIQRVVDNELRYNETIQLLQMCNRKLFKMKDQLPPGFELSKHYFDLIKEEK